VRFAAEGSLRGASRALEPLLRLMLGRQMTRYHANLRRNVEAL
jgi:hypothetical protein